MIFTNGQFLGPELRLKQGDNVEFYVNNNLPNATTIHFHGMLIQPMQICAILI
jgi:Putative multicopper oxidases